MPAHNRLGLDDHKAGLPVRPEPRQPDPQDPVTPTQTRSLHRALEDAELVAKSQVLGGQGCAREEERAEEAEDQPYHVHRVASVRFASG